MKTVPSPTTERAADRSPSRSHSSPTMPRSSVPFGSDDAPTRAIAGNSLTLEVSSKIYYIGAAYTVGETTSCADYCSG